MNVRELITELERICAANANDGYDIDVEVWDQADGMKGLRGVEDDASIVILRVAGAWEGD